MKLRPWNWGEFAVSLVVLAIILSVMAVWNHTVRQEALDLCAQSSGAGLAR